MNMKYRIVFCLLMLLGLTCIAEARTPLVQDGKKSVYQRVITHPNARLYAKPEVQAAIVRDPVKTFTAMYIYSKQGDWLEVGTSSTQADGWMRKTDVTEWSQAITMVFTDRTGRSPVLFFKNHAALENTCQADSVANTVRGYAQTLANKADTLPPDFPVLASEPQDSAVAEKNFYLLPVLGIDNQYEGMKLLEVASINPGISKSQPANNAGSELRTGFAFVIDTTISMKPYIEQSLKLIRSVYDELEKSPHGDKMAFAIVAFRSNLNKSPNLKYTSKIICDFTTVKDRAKLENALAQVEEATVSSHSFNEDSFAGIKQAADNLSWKNYDSRVMLLISDAGPLGAGDSTSATGFSPEALADYLRTNKIYLTALHIKSPSGQKNHKYAEKSYMTLTMQSNNQASYIPLDASTPAKGTYAFNSASKVLAQSYAAMLAATAEGKLLRNPAQQKQKKQDDSSPEEKAAQIAASTGYAMQLQFFGNAKGATAPQVVKAWIADADLEKLENNPGVPVLAAEPAVLLTKGQLSNLYRQLKVLLHSSEEAFLNGQDDLFAQLRSAAVQMSRDPNQFSLHPDRNLVENGLLDEVLDGLPYKSRVSGLTRKDWESMSTGDRQQFINRLKSLIARYEEYDKDATHWESFGSPNAEDWVYRVPLSMLP